MTICIRAWNDLGTERQFGMAVGPIPVSAILRWCEFEEFDRESTAILRDAIRTADNLRAQREADKRNVNNATGGKR